MPRRIIAYLATSADGFIARKDGSVDWLDRPRPKGNYGMGDFVRSVDTILIGRKTWEHALRMTGGRSPASFSPGVRHYVFSKAKPRLKTPGAELVKESVADFAKRLRSEPGKDVWMMGGGALIASFLDAGELDAFSIHVVPVLIGEGIPLLSPRRRLVRLKLTDTTTFPDGVVHLGYDVVREPPTSRRRASRAR
jgi:dihydrofolate reductase